jgi:tetratricopeptide (TPR) repeat protein
MVRARLDDYDGGLQALRAALALALEHDLTPVAAEIYQHLSATLLLSADYPRAEQALDTAMELCRLDPDPTGFAACMPCLAYVLYERGEWSRAADICREMIAAGNTVFVAEGMLGAIYEAEGRLSSARRLSTSALAGAKQFGHYDMTVFATATLARLAAAEGDEPEAAARCRELLARWEESEDRHYAVSGLRWSVTFSVSRGNRVDAHTYAGALARIASPSGTGTPSRRSRRRSANARCSRATRPAPSSSWFAPWSSTPRSTCRSSARRSSSGPAWPWRRPMNGSSHSTGWAAPTERRASSGHGPWPPPRRPR